MFRAEIFITLKSKVLDPQGKQVEEALHSLGYEEVKEVRVGKYIVLKVEEKKGKIEERLREMCEKLLANPVIEDYTYRIEKLP